MDPVFTLAFHHLSLVALLHLLFVQVPHKLLAALQLQDQLLEVSAVPTVDSCKV